MDSYNLERFIDRQKYSFETALSEIKAGHKQTHWIWFIFPQLKGLGSSSRALRYGITDLGEAKAYMENPILRENLITITKALLELDESNPTVVMGPLDNVKLCSCMTLFEIVAPDVPEFGMVLDKFYNGRRDKMTIGMIERNS